MGSHTRVLTLIFSPLPSVFITFRETHALPLLLLAARSCAFCFQQPTIGMHLSLYLGPSNNCACEVMFAQITRVLFQTHRWGPPPNTLKYSRIHQLICSLKANRAHHSQSLSGSGKRTGTMKEIDFFWLVQSHHNNDWSDFPVLLHLICKNL